MSYCGLLCLLLGPQIFVRAGRRARYWFGGLLAMVILPQIFPYFRYAFWLFSGDYYRNFSHIYGIVMQVLALTVLYRIVSEKKINSWLLAGTLCFLLVVLFFPWEIKSSPGLKMMVAFF